MAFIVDGFSTTITLSTSLLTFIERTVQPPGYSGGGKLNATGMRNKRIRTFAPKNLITVEDAKLQVYYDPVMYAAGQCQAAMQLVQAFVFRFPDASGVTIYGWLEEFKPVEAREGEDEYADITICFGNMVSNAEYAPFYSAGPIAVPSASVPGNLAGAPGLK
jgi:hypothetical protein